jgi:uroporphyrin-III C-methyltransferase
MPASDQGGSLHPVSLVGAGPGPLELLTIRGLRRIQQADVVIHDHLVGAEVLAAVRPGAELVFVGKRGGQFCRPQAEIEELLVRHGRSGKRVVRLKGGDPLIFGRGGEEAATLAAAGLQYEIVPGVTAALAAGASTGIPLTHREFSSAVVFLTGHENPDKPDSTLPWEAYGRLNATLCIYMGVKNLGSILSRLQAGGMRAELPAALVQSAASDQQRLLVATVGTLAERAAAEKFSSPALAIVGAVVGGARPREALADPRVNSNPNAAGPSGPGGGAAPKYALIDNGSLAPASTLNLRRMAAEIGVWTGVPIDPVSWKHSDRIASAELGGMPAETIRAWFERQRRSGAREFRFVPFFISPQGAIGSALRRDLEGLAAELGGAFDFTSGLDKAVPVILASNIRDAIAQARHPTAPAALAGAAPPPPPWPVVIVDHGGPSRHSAVLRDQIVSEVAALLGDGAGSITGASMESPEGLEFAFNRPLLSEALGALAASGATDAIIAPLFLSPGRHAGPDGDLAQIARAFAPRLRCHFTGLVGTHPLAAAALAASIPVPFFTATASVQP